MFWLAAQLPEFARSRTALQKRKQIDIPCVPSSRPYPETPAMGACVLRVSPEAREAQADVIRLRLVVFAHQ